LATHFPIPKHFVAAFRGKRPLQTDSNDTKRFRLKAGLQTIKLQRRLPRRGKNETPERYSEAPQIKTPHNDGGARMDGVGSIALRRGRRSGTNKPKRRPAPSLGRQRQSDQHHFRQEHPGGSRIGARRPNRILSRIPGGGPLYRRKDARLLAPEIRRQPDR